MSKFSQILPAKANGIDVSKWQGDIDWAKVREAKIDFAYIKATEGAGYRDPKFRQNIAQAHELAPNILIGCYHFARVSSTDKIGIENDAEIEAASFAKEISLYKSCWALPPMLDLEWDTRTTPIPAKDILLWAKTFLTTIEKLLLTTCGVYTQYSYWLYKMAKSSALFQHPLWLAGKKQIPGWDPMIIQTTSKGKVNGISGNVDLDIWVHGSTPVIQSPSMITSLLINTIARFAGVPHRSDT